MSPSTLLDEMPCYTHNKVNIHAALRNIRANNTHVWSEFGSDNYSTVNPDRFTSNSPKSRWPCVRTRKV